MCDRHIIGGHVLEIAPFKINAIQILEYVSWDKVLISCQNLLDQLSAHEFPDQITTHELDPMFGESLSPITLCCSIFFHSVWV